MPNAARRRKVTFRITTVYLRPECKTKGLPTIFCPLPSHFLDVGANIVQWARLRKPRLPLSHWVWRHMPPPLCSRSFRAWRFFSLPMTPSPDQDPDPVPSPYPSRRVERSCPQRFWRIPASGHDQFPRLLLTTCPPIPYLQLHSPPTGTDSPGGGMHIRETEDWLNPHPTPLSSSPPLPSGLVAILHMSVILMVRRGGICSLYGLSFYAIVRCFSITGFGVLRSSD